MSISIAGILKSSSKAAIRQEEHAAALMEKQTAMFLKLERSIKKVVKQEVTRQRQEGDDDDEESSDAVAEYEEMEASEDQSDDEQEGEPMDEGTHKRKQGDITVTQSPKTVGKTKSTTTLQLAAKKNGKLSTLNPNQYNSRYNQGKGMRL